MSEYKVWLITGAIPDSVKRLRGRHSRAETGLRQLLDAPKRSPSTAGRNGLCHSPLDVTDPAGVNATVAATLEHFGRIDVLVNNAGHRLVGALEELSDEQIDDVLSVNVIGAARVTRGTVGTGRGSYALLKRQLRA